VSNTTAMETSAWSAMADTSQVASPLAPGHETKWKPSADTTFSRGEPPPTSPDTSNPAAVSVNKPPMVAPAETKSHWGAALVSVNLPTANSARDEPGVSAAGLQ